MTPRNSLPILGGARYDVIDDAPGDRRFYVAMAFILLFTASVAGISMAFAMGMIFHAEAWAAASIGVFWALGILVIDRALTIQLTDARGKRTWIAVIPRVALAAILGLVISTPITLQIFAPEIEAELVRIANEERAAFESELDADPRLASEPDLRETISEQDAIIAASRTVDPLQDASYAQARALADAALAEANAKRDAWVAESNGTGGTGIVGTGPITDIAYAAYQAALAESERANAEADRLQAAAVAAIGRQNTENREAAEAVRADAQGELTEVVADRHARQEAFEAASAASGGVSNRLLALHRLSVANSWAAFAHVSVFLLFFTIELLPVTVKLLRRGDGMRSVHDELAAKQDETAIDNGFRRLDVDAEASRTTTAIERETHRTRRAVALDGERLESAYGRWMNGEVDLRRRAAATLGFQLWDAEMEADGAAAVGSGPGTGGAGAGGDGGASDGASDAAIAAPVAAAVPRDVPLTAEERRFQGRLLGGRFALEEALRERGATGRVWKAHDRATGRRAAVKILDRPSDGSTLGEDEANRRAWRHEVQMLDRLPKAHENVVEILQYGVDPDSGEYWIASAFYEPGNVYLRLQPEFAKPLAKRPELRHVVGWMLEIASGLAAAHAEQVSHGDLKPANLVFDRAHIRIIDFGLARAVEVISGPAASGLDRGTPYFVAPEMVLREGVDREVRPKLADLYSLGAIFYWMLTSTFPRMVPGEPRALNPLAQRMWDGENPLVPLAEDLPEELRDLVGELLAVDPESRYHSWDDSIAAVAVVDALTAIRAAMTKQDGRLHVGANLLAPEAAGESVADGGVETGRSAGSAASAASGASARLLGVGMPDPMSTPIEDDTLPYVPTLSPAEAVDAGRDEFRGPAVGPR